MQNEDEFRPIDNFFVVFSDDLSNSLPFSTFHSIISLISTSWSICTFKDINLLIHAPFERYGRVWKIEVFPYPVGKIITASPARPASSASFCSGLMSWPVTFLKVSLNCAMVVEGLLEGNMIFWCHN